MPIFALQQFAKINQSMIEVAGMTRFKCGFALTGGGDANRGEKTLAQLRGIEVTIGLERGLDMLASTMDC